MRDDAELFRDRIGTTATSLLGLLGIEADPLQSREHILLAKLFEAAWREGRDLDLPGLIQQIQSPPIAKVGALDLEAFFPGKDRFALATRLNNLLAAPGFDAWLEGEPLDIGALLHTPEGKPRAAIFSIAHLSDAERMFFVSLLLNEMLGWVRAQSGTTSLRALLYMDEVFGYFPPVANPPSKLPLLTLLKQARAFGVGVVLATQNPVDLDYKGLANTGTWFIGRLQTDRDRARVLDGLEGAAAGGDKRFDRAAMEEILGGLGSRVFLLNNVHEDAPEVFETRWAMSYLRGPLTRTQIKQLMAGRKPAPARVPSARRPAGAAPAASRDPAPAASAAPAPSRGGARPVLPPGVPQHFVPVRGTAPAGAALVYQPMVLGAATVRFADAKAGVDQSEEVVVATPVTDAAVPVSWEGAIAHRRRRRRPRGSARRRRGLGAAPLGRRQAQELRGLEPGPGGVALRAAAARAPPRPRLGRALAPGRERARLPGAGPRGIPGRARRARGGPPQEVRAQAGGARGAPPARAAGGGAESGSRSASRASRRRSRSAPRSSAPCSGGRR